MYIVNLILYIVILKINIFLFLPLHSPENSLATDKNHIVPHNHSHPLIKHTTHRQNIHSTTTNTNIKTDKTFTLVHIEATAPSINTSEASLTKAQLSTLVQHGTNKSLFL